jgi:hypothetical protein
VGRYTEFTLYWEQWGGYANRETPFGLPRLAWFIASPEGAMRCLVAAQHKGPMDRTWGADWQQIPGRLLGPIPGLLEEAGAFGQFAPLLKGGTEDDATIEYLVVDELTGAVRDRPFRLVVHTIVPSFSWPSHSLGERLSGCLAGLMNCEPGTI